MAAQLQQRAQQEQLEATKVQQELLMEVQRKKELATIAASSAAVKELDAALYGPDAKKKRKARDDDDNDEPTEKRRKGRDRIKITFEATSEWLASKLRDRDTFKEELLRELECEGWGARSPAKPSPARRLTD